MSFHCSPDQLLLRQRSRGARDDVSRPRGPLPSRRRPGRVHRHSERAHAHPVRAVPENPSQLLAEARSAEIDLDGPYNAPLVQGDDELGGLARIHERLFEANIDVYASSGVSDGRGAFGYVSTCATTSSKTRRTHSASRGRRRRPSQSESRMHDRRVDRRCEDRADRRRETAHGRHRRTPRRLRRRNTPRGHPGRARGCREAPAARHDRARARGDRPEAAASHWRNHVRLVASPRRDRRHGRADIG